MNAADTWVDLFSIDNDHFKRGSVWMSETGLLEFIVIMSACPQSLIDKYSNITGKAFMP
jgi:alpha-glucosidase (family GH31 glycosyl hydrolase)